MSEQLTLFEKAMLSDNLQKKMQSVKRKWESAFQTWSNEQELDGADS